MVVALTTFAADLKCSKVVDDDDDAHLKGELFTI